MWQNQKRRRRNGEYVVEDDIVRIEDDYHRIKDLGFRIEKGEK